MVFKIHQKIGVIMLLMTSLIAVAGLSGYVGVSRLSESLDFITHQAWDAADGSMEGTIELQGEMLAAERILAGRISVDEGRRQIVASAEAAAEALARMEKSGLMADTEIAELSRQLEQYRGLRGAVVAGYAEFQQLSLAAGANLDAIDGRLGALEAELEAGMDDNALEFLAPVTIQAMWDIADAIMESRIGLLSASHALSQFKLGADAVEQKRRIDQGLGLAREQIALLAGTRSPLMGRLIGSADQQALQALFDEQAELIRQAVSRYEILQTSQGRFAGVSASLLEFLEQLEESGDAKVEGETANMKNTVSTAYTTIIAAIVIGLLVAAGVCLFSIKFIARPIADIAARLRAVAASGGDLTQVIPVRGGDEIADLAQGFNLFVAEIRRIIDQVKQLSLDLASEIGKLDSVFEQTANGAVEQYSETEQVAAAVEEMSATVSGVAQHASEAVEVMQSASQVTERGLRYTRETAADIEHLSNDMESATEVIGRVRVEADEIGGVLDVIRSIAEQTNLLALNAAIEAARAGEQGRGFAVVADEVRTLASRTQQSTTEIQTMIDNLQSGTQNAVEVITRSHAQTSNSVRSSQQAGEALDEVFAAMNRIGEINRQIEIATREQDAASRVIGEKAQNINLVAEATSQQATSASQSTSALLTQSQRLTELVDQFKTA